MLDAVKRYATKILLLHLVLLVVVIFFVMGAARQVQVSAREEAQSQSKERLQLLADQTARGVESHYNSILYDLSVMLGDPVTTTAPSSSAATNPAAEVGPPRGALAARGGRGAGAAGGRGGRGRFNPLPPVNPGPVPANPETLNLIWRQIRARTSQIFLVELANQSISVSYPDNSQRAAQTIARQNIAWLRSITSAQMSRFILSEPNAQGERTGYHLIAVPAIDVSVPNQRGGPNGAGGRPGQGAPGGGGFGGPAGAFDGPGGPGFGGRSGGPGASLGGPPDTQPASITPAQYAVVVVVPISNAREEFLNPLNLDLSHEVSAILVNDEGETLVANPARTIGMNLLEQLSPVIRARLEPLIKGDPAGSADEAIVIDAPYQIGTTTFPPQILAAARLDVPSGRHWSVLISSPLSEAETIVNRVFGAAVLWAVFVSIAITGILFSTSFFMIRSRMRFERTRHDMLTRELEQARQIQLAWLPDLKSTPAGLDISAANLPASHISGDFYNWFTLAAPARIGGNAAGANSPANSRVAIVIGDVTGHGMAAAFLMATTQLLVRMTLTRYGDPARALREVNQQLCTQGFQGQFVTMLLMVLDLNTNQLEIATAGHPTPLIETSDPSATGDGSFSAGKRRFQSLELEPQLVLGVDPAEDYRSQTFTLEPGASVLLYTDGVIEAESETGAQYGVENFIRVLERQTAEGDPAADSDPAACIRAVLADVNRFCGNRELMDDVTLVAIRTAAVAASLPQS